MLNDLEIKLVKLDLPFRLNHVNCFLAKGENGWVVIDAGLHNKETVERWENELSGKEVTDIFITHYHPDHFGYAGGLQQKYNAKVSMSEVDAKNGLNAWEDEFLADYPDYYNLSGIPEEVGHEMLKNTKDFVPRITPYPEVHHYFQEGEKVVIGKYEYEILFTPGHSDGLINFYNKDKSVLISTDHILPRITPNISYWFHGDPDPLKTYLESLNKVKQLDAEYVIPSHGKPFYGANERIDEIISHHDDRLNETIEAMKDHHTVYDICQALFQFKLTVHETRFAIGETIAHLEFLRNKDMCQREEVNGQWYYKV